MYTFFLPEAESVTLTAQLGAALMVVRLERAGDTGEILATARRSPEKEH